MLVWLGARLAALWASKLGRQIIIGGVALLVISFAFRYWLVKHDDKIYQQGKNAEADLIKNQKVAEWEARDKKLAEREKDVDVKVAALDGRQKEIDARAVQINKVWEASRQTLLQVTAASAARREEADAQVDRIPASELLDSLRAQSDALAAAKPRPQ